MKGFALLLFVAGCISMTGCRNDSESLDPKQIALNENQAKWSNASVSSYRFTISYSCYCPVQESRVITVVDNVVTEAFFTPSGSMIESDEFVDYWIVDDYFGRIQTGIDEEYSVLDVTYDPTYGFPTKIFIDESPAIADEEISYFIRDFQ